MAKKVKEQLDKSNQYCFTMASHKRLCQFSCRPKESGEVLALESYFQLTMALEQNLNLRLREITRTKKTE